MCAAIIAYFPFIPFFLSTKTHQQVWAYSQ